MTAEAKVARAHWGVSVVAMDGTPLVGIHEGQFFQPASNAKLFTTAAAMALLGPERTVRTEVLVGNLSEAANPTNSLSRSGSVVLVGSGDATLSGTELPYVAPAAQEKPSVDAPPPLPPDPLRPLAELADQVVASGVKVVPGDVVGDDSLWPWEPYPQDWAMDDAVWGYGAPVSALSVADNLLRLTITPGASAGKAATVSLAQTVPYYTLESSVMTAGADQVGGGVAIERAPGSRVLRVYGHIAAGASARVEEIAIADPAEYAAMVFKAMLEHRGVVVKGRALALHREFVQEEGWMQQVREPLPVARGEAGTPRPPGVAPSYDLGGVNDCDLRGHAGMNVVASRISAALTEDVVLTNKTSQNLHAELLLRRLGAALGDAGTATQGARVVRSFVAGAGIDPDDVVLYDGSGLSGHDLVTPRATTRLLTWASGQPWFAAWRASLPVGGVDGSLASRFGGKSRMRGRVFAKTGTLGEARALSGYLVGASGRTVAFSVMVTDHAPGEPVDREVMDRIVEAIGAAT